MSTNTSSSMSTITDNFEVMLTTVTYLGVTYKPVPAHLKLLGLQSLLAGGKDALNQVSAGESALSLAIAQRAALYAVLPGLMTRIVNTLYACSPDTPMRSSMESNLRRFRGQRASAPPMNPDGTPGESHSVSEGSYGNQVKVLNDVINDVGKDPLYMPEEDDLKLVNLAAYRDALMAANSAVTNARTALKQARQHRDAVLFGKPNGMVAVAQQVKAYLKGAFGATSPQYKQVSGLVFIRR